MTLWGKILFGTMPTPTAALGMVMIAAAGIITAMREGYQRRKAGTPAPTPQK